MRIYFKYLGIDFSKYNITNVHFDYIQFTTKDGREFIIEATGELDIDFKITEIDGRFKGELEITDENSAQLKENEAVEDIFINMDKKTFRIGLLDDESDIGIDPIWKHLHVSVEFNPIPTTKAYHMVPCMSPFTITNLGGITAVTKDIVPEGKRMH